MRFQDKPNTILLLLQKSHVLRYTCVLLTRFSFAVVNTGNSINQIKYYYILYMYTGIVHVHV
jgi:hypothetical protein